MKLLKSPLSITDASTFHYVDRNEKRKDSKPEYSFSATMYVVGKFLNKSLLETSSRLDV